MYTARCARTGYDNAVRRNRDYQEANGQNKTASGRGYDLGGAPGGAAPRSSEAAAEAAESPA